MPAKHVPLLAACRGRRGALFYWIPAFAGMTAVLENKLKNKFLPFVHLSEQGGEIVAERGKNPAIQQAVA